MLGLVADFAGAGAGCRSSVDADVDDVYVSTCDGSFGIDADRPSVRGPGPGKRSSAEACPNECRRGRVPGTIAYVCVSAGSASC